MEDRSDGNKETSSRVMGVGANRVLDNSGDRNRIIGRAHRIIDRALHRALGVRIRDRAMIIFLRSSAKNRQIARNVQLWAWRASCRSVAIGSSPHSEWRLKCAPQKLSVI